MWRHSIVAYKAQPRARFQCNPASRAQFFFVGFPEYVGYIHSELHTRFKRLSPNAAQRGCLVYFMDEHGRASMGPVQAVHVAEASRQVCLLKQTLRVADSLI